MVSPLTAASPYRPFVLAALFVAASGVVSYPLVLDVHSLEAAQATDYAIVVLVSVLIAAATVALTALGVRSQRHRLVQIASSILTALVTAAVVFCVVLLVTEIQFNMVHKVWTSVWSSAVYAKMIGTIWPLLALQGLAQLLLLWTRNRTHPKSGSYPDAGRLVGGLNGPSVDAILSLT